VVAVSSSSLRLLAVLRFRDDHQDEEGNDREAAALTGAAVGGILGLETKNLLALVLVPEKGLRLAPADKMERTIIVSPS